MLWGRIITTSGRERGMNLAWFKHQGLRSLTERLEWLQSSGNRRIQMSTYSGVGGRGSELLPIFEKKAKAKRKPKGLKPFGLSY